jgi:hypothetical protein
MISLKFNLLNLIKRLKNKHLVFKQIYLPGKKFVMLFIIVQISLLYAMELLRIM